MHTGSLIGQFTPTPAAAAPRVSSLASGSLESKAGRQGRERAARVVGGVVGPPGEEGVGPPQRRAARSPSAAQIVRP